MKIRTRILWLSGTAVLAAFLLGDLFLWVLVQKSFLNEAVVKASQSAYEISDRLVWNLERNPSLEDDDIFLQYYFKNLHDDFNICVRTWPELTEIYNHTNLSMEQLSELEFDENKDYRGFQSARLDWGGSHYMIFFRQQNGRLNYYRVADISGVWDKMRGVTLCMLAISLGVGVTVVLLLSIFLKKALHPLQVLNDTTKRMAAGLYDQRITVGRQDEIGQLGESFNKMAEAVETRTRSLEESEKRKTLFMGDLTHELKTPMTAISGYAQTLLSVKLKEEDRQEALLYIYEECRRLERLSRKMMKLLELDQEGELVFEMISVQQIFIRAERSCQGILKEKQLTLECSQQGQAFFMDEDLMTDVLVNLIDNAGKASAPGSKILLKAEGSFLEVRDFGCGIPKEEQDKILEPFYMVDKSRSRRYGGAGLGLALTAMILKKHRVSLEIQSQVGEGTRMILRFPSDEA